MSRTQGRAPGKEKGIVLRERRNLIWLIVSIVLVVALPILLFALPWKNVVERGVAALVSLLVTTAGAIVVYVRQVVYNPRMVIRKKHVQLRQGAGRITGQIPYPNIVSVELADRVVNEGTNDERHYWVLEVILINRRDPETWWPRMVKDQPCDLEIVDLYEKPLSKVRSLILERVRRHREEKGYAPL